MTRGTADFRWRGLLRGPRTKAEDAERNAGAPALTVGGIELVHLSESELLLRVSGTWAPSAPGGVELLIASRKRLEPLPPGPVEDADGRWSAAFAIEPGDESGPLALVSDAAGQVDLPAPAAQDSQPTVPTPEELDPAEELESARLLIAQLRRRCELSERGLADFRDKLVQAWGEASHVREMIDAREATYATAAQRVQQAHAMVEEIEARARDRADELARQREAVEAECARLEAELATRPTREQAAAETAALQAEAEGAIERFRAARAEADELNGRLADARSIAAQATDLAATAARELLAERARNAEAAALADRNGELLAKAERELAEAREELAAAEARIDELEATSLEALAAAEERIAHAEAKAAGAVAAAEDRLAQAQADSSEALAAAEARLAEAEAKAAEAQAHAETEAAEAVAAAEQRVAELEGKSGEALVALKTARADSEQLRERAAATERELAGARERLEAAERATAELAKSEQALRQQVESLTRTDLGNDDRRGRSKVSARVYREALAKLEQEQAARARAEDDAARLADQVRELEKQPEEPAPAAPGDATVEEDLRHLLAARQRELDEVRMALKEQRARYAAVASQLTPSELAETAEPRPEAPWTAVDEDLLGRLKRAKELAGQD